MVHAGDDIGMWDEEDGFFYDVLRLPDGRAERLKVRSMVGLLPLCAVTVFEGDNIWRTPEIVERLRRFLIARPELRAFIHDPAGAGRGRAQARRHPQRSVAAPRAGRHARRAANS